MKTDTGTISGSYFDDTRGILYSYLIALPLLLLYEVLILISQPLSGNSVRISVDVWMKSLFHFLGFQSVTATLLIAALLGAMILYRKRTQLPSLKTRYFSFMIVESVLYAILVTVLIVGFLDALLMMQSEGPLAEMNKLHLFALSLGAGLYEELFFRVILVSLLALLFGLLTKKKFIAYGASATVAALIFSGVHYVGEFGDFLELGSFLFRFLFGLALNLIYVIRGFGIAAWTHALYDVFVILQL